MPGLEAQEVELAKRVLGLKAPLPGQWAKVLALAPEVLEAEMELRWISDRPRHQLPARGIIPGQASPRHEIASAGCWLRDRRI